MKTDSRLDTTYTPEQLEKMIVEMRKVSNAFYRNAVTIGNHAFIEFCGLMNEYINMCSATVAAGGDFTECNVHTGKSLTIRDYQGAYLAEKFECIFGPTMASNPKIAADFARIVTGVVASA